MGDNNNELPPRVKASFDFIYHTWRITEQVNSAIPTRDLTPLERNVETVALRTIMQFMLGEIDFVDKTEPSPTVTTNSDQKVNANA